MALGNQGVQSYWRMKREDASPCLLCACSSNSTVCALSKAVPSGDQEVLQRTFVGAEEDGVEVTAPCMDMELN